MKNTLFKYTLEFIVIVIGISLSFYVEKMNEEHYRKNLKNQSLKRILKNIEVDTGDFQYNLSATRRALYSIDWLIKNRAVMNSLSRDSIGYHLNRAIYFNTIFVDNQEEYRALQNSGLIEIIENENVVVKLQEKYITHGFMKKIEDIILKKAEKFDAYVFQNLKYQRNKTNDLGLQYDRTFVGEKKLPNTIFEMLQEMGFFRRFYSSRIINRKKNDSVLIEEIQNEINLN